MQAGGWCANRPLELQGIESSAILVLLTALVVFECNSQPPGAEVKNTSCTFKLGPIPCISASQHGFYQAREVKKTVGKTVMSSCYSESIPRVWSIREDKMVIGFQVGLCEKCVARRVIIRGRTERSVRAQCNYLGVWPY